MIVYEYYYVIGSFLVASNSNMVTLERVLEYEDHYPIIVKAKNWSDVEKKIERWILKKFPKSSEVAKLQKPGQPYYSGAGALMFEGKRTFIFKLPSQNMTHLPADISSVTRSIKFG